MKKIISLFLVLLAVFTLFSCNDEKVLTTPSNVSLSEAGLITWDVVPNATSYVVILNGESITVETPFYLVSNLKADFSYSIIACADGYTSSVPSDLLVYKAPKPETPKPPVSNIVVGISGSSEVKNGKSITLKANVSGYKETDEVTWHITKGSEYATIDENGLLTAKDIDDEKGNVNIEVVAKSKENKDCYGTKTVTILARPKLTQEMINVLANEDYISFEGYINITLYPFGSNKVYSTYSTVVKTALDGEYWYAEYENADSMTKLGIYYKEHNGYACQVGVNFMNQEQYDYALDDFGQPLSWEEYGLYNNFKGLTVSDFEFDEETWRWTYCGNDNNLDSKMVTSANPYEFKADGFSLIVEDGEIMGIYAKSLDDYSIIEQYKAIQELFVAINCGEENVEVRKVPKYYYDEEVHGNLKTAIDKIHSANNYTLTYKDIQGSSMANGVTETGFKEYITGTDRYFVPFNVSYDKYGQEVHEYKENETYGFKKITDQLYNAYYEVTNERGESLGFKASRAYEESFDKCLPSFAFAPEIFNSYYIDEEENTTTYYVDEIMNPVASTFYYGVGSDINLYGIYASTGYISNTESFTPYCVVDNETKELISTGFYYYLGYIYGVVEITYSDYNNTTLPEDADIDFEVRNVPTSWSELTITKSDLSSSTAEDIEVNALEFLYEFFGVEPGTQEAEQFISDMPFFGEAIGDTYGFGLTSFHIDSQNRNNPAITFYYDVPLDVDYSIESSLEKVYEYLLQEGFTRNSAGEFNKGNIWVAPVDQNLDFIIYVWKR
jgi:hypothetical protein